MGPVSLNKKLSLSGVELRRARGPAEPCPTGLMLLRLVEALAGESSPPSVQSALRHLQQSLQEGASFSWAFHRLSVQEKTLLEAAIGKAITQECLALSVEKDLSEAEASAFRIATRLEAGGKSLEAMALYQVLLATSQSGVAQGRLDALMGKLNPGGRFEVLLRDFSGQATDYRMILPMMAGTFSYGMTRAASLGVLGRYHSIAKARRLAALTGFGVEVPVFSFSARALHQWSGDPVSWEGKEVWRDLASAGMTLGLLKLAGGMGHRAHAKVSLAYPALSGTSQWLLPQGAAYVGLLAAHGLETWVGLRERIPGENVALNTLATLISLGVGAKLGHALMGQSLTRFSQEYQLRSEAGLRQLSNLNPSRGYELKSDNVENHSTPRRLSLNNLSLPDGAVSALLSGEWLKRFENYFAPNFGKISALTRGVECIYFEANFEIYLQKVSTGTLIHNGRLYGGMSRRDGLYIVRNGAWDQPMEVRPLAALSPGDFILWRRADGERVLRVFREDRYPPSWEDFPTDKLKAPDRSGREVSNTQTNSSPSPTPPKQWLPEAEEASEVPNFPVPEFAGEEYWYEGVEPKRPAEKIPTPVPSAAEKVIEISDADIESIRIVTPPEIPAAKGHGSNLSLLDLKGGGGGDLVEPVRSIPEDPTVPPFFSLKPGEGLAELKQRLLENSPQNDAPFRQAFGRIVDLVFSKRESDLKTVQEIREAVAAKIAPLEITEGKQLIQPTLEALSGFLGTRIQLWFDPLNPKIKPIQAAAILSHFYPDEVLVHARMKKHVGPIHSCDPDYLALEYGIPPEKLSKNRVLSQAVTLGEFRKRNFPYVEPYSHYFSDTIEPLNEMPLAKTFRIAERYFVYRVERILKGSEEYFTFSRIHPKVSSEEAGVDAEVDRLGVRNFQVKAPRFGWESEDSGYLEALMDFLEIQRIPAAVFKEGEVYDLEGLIALAELESPGTPITQNLRRSMFPARLRMARGGVQILKNFGAKDDPIYHFFYAENKTHFNQWRPSSGYNAAWIVSSKDGNEPLILLKNDSNSRESIFLNGSELPPDATHVLRNLDTIQLGVDGEKLIWLEPGYSGTPPSPQEKP